MSILEDLIFIHYGGALLAFRRDEFILAVKRGKYIRRCEATEGRERKRLESEGRRKPSAGERADSQDTGLYQTPCPRGIGPPGASQEAASSVKGRE